MTGDKIIVGSRIAENGNTSNMKLRYKYDQSPSSSYQSKRHQHSNFITGAHAAAAVNASREKKKYSQLDDLFDFDS